MSAGCIVIDAALAQKLGRAVGMRNVLAYDYTRVDRALLAAAVDNDLGDLRAFGAKVAQRMPPG